MALLRLPCSPSTPYPRIDHYSKPHKSPPLLLSLSSSSSSSPFSSSFSSSSSILNRTNKTNLFLPHILPPTPYSLHLSSLIVNVAANTQAEVEEYSQNRLLASNVPWTCTPEDIRSLFEKFGTVVDVELSMYNKTRNRGLAFVTMGSPEEALAALKGLELSEFEGRTLKLNYAKPKKQRTSLPPPPKMAITFNLFVANLSFEARAKDLKEFFISEGANVDSAEIIFHNNPRKSSGYGFVSFKSKKEADEALTAFQGKKFMGRPIRVQRSRQFVRQPKEEEGLQSGDATTESNAGLMQADTANDN